MQELIHKAARWDEAQEAKKTVAAKPLPPVQRPGVTQSGKPGRDAEITTLKRQLNSATGLQALRIATQLTKLHTRVRPALERDANGSRYLCLYLLFGGRQQRGSVRYDLSD